MDPRQVFAKVIHFLNKGSAFYCPCTAKIFEAAPWRETFRLEKLKVSEEAERKTGAAKSKAMITSCPERGTQHKRSSDHSCKYCWIWVLLLLSRLHWNNRILESCKECWGSYLHTERDCSCVIHNDSSSPFWEEEEEQRASNGKLDTWIDVLDYGESAHIDIHLVIDRNYQPIIISQNET